MEKIIVIMRIFVKKSVLIVGIVLLGNEVFVTNLSIKLIHATSCIVNLNFNILTNCRT